MKPKKLFFIWNELDEKFYQYTSLVEALSFNDEGNGVEIFEASIKSIGTYKFSEPQIIKVKGKK